MISVLAGNKGLGATMMIVQVECYSGFKADERPLRFQLGERWLAVEEVMDRWYDPAAIYFRVRAGDGDLYILRHHERDNLWTLESFRKGEPLGPMK
ncbi:MAG: hypothetical protein LAO21_13645 [Acidobacteriia bacterium]|nr:hypothetical protein [Terriglobia bacterium]